MEIPERFKDGDDADEDITLLPGATAYMNQSVFGMIAAAGSQVDFNARFDAQSSDEEDDEMDEDNDEDGSRNSNSAEVGHDSQLSCPSAPNLNKHNDDDVDFEYLEQLDREIPLFIEGDDR